MTSSVAAPHRRRASTHFRGCGPARWHDDAHDGTRCTEAYAVLGGGGRSSRSLAAGCTHRPRHPPATPAAVLTAPTAPDALAPATSAPDLHHAAGTGHDRGRRRRPLRGRPAQPGCATRPRPWRPRRRRSPPPTWRSSTSRPRSGTGGQPRARQALHVLGRAARPSPRWPRRGSTWPAWPTTTPSTTAGPGCPARSGPRGRPRTPIRHSRWSASVVTRDEAFAPGRHRVDGTRVATLGRVARRPGPDGGPDRRSGRPPHDRAGIADARRPVPPARAVRRTPTAPPTWSWSTSTGASRASAARPPTSAAWPPAWSRPGPTSSSAPMPTSCRGTGGSGRGYVAYGLGNFAWYSPGTPPPDRRADPHRPAAARAGRGRARVVRAAWWPARIGPTASPCRSPQARQRLPRPTGESLRALRRPRRAERSPARRQPRQHDPADPLELGRLTRRPARRSAEW